MNLSKVFSILFGVIIFFLIVYVVGIEKIIQSFKDFNFIYLPLILFILFFLYILAGINTWIIAKAFGKVSLGYVIKTTFITLVYAVIIPGKLADLLMIPFLKKQGLNLSQSTITIGLDKIISLVIKSVFGLFGAIFILKKFDLLFFGLPLISICLIFIVVLLVKSKTFLNFVKNKLLKKYSVIFKEFSKNLKFYLKHNKKNLFYNSIITIIKTFLEALLFFVLFLSFGQFTDIFVIFFMFSLLAVIMLLTFPVGISGIGVREVIAIFIFGAVGVDSVVVFNSFIIRLLLIYIINLFTIYFLRNELVFIKTSGLFKRIKF